MTELFLFTELQDEALTDGRAFDGVAFGTFRDMLGREITLESDDAVDYVANTQAAIEATRTESGELVGLPIDAKGHDKGDGAGWIVGAELVEGVIRFIPKWTEIGRELIGKGIRRFFSATIDISNKVVIGGTLTNWPATRNEANHVMLRPIELEGMYTTELQKTEDGVQYPARCYLDRPNPDSPSTWGLRICESVDGSITVTRSQLGRAAAALSPGGFRGRRFQRKEGGKSIDALKSALVSQYRRLGVERANIPAYLFSMEETMTENEEVRKGEEAPVAPEVQAVEPAPPVDKEYPPEVTADLVSEFVDAANREPAELAQRIQERAERLAQNRMREMMERREQEWQITQLSAHYTGGARYGLPITVTELTAFLSSLDANQLRVAQALFGKITDSGLVEFQEIGHGRRLLKQPVPEEYRDSLRAALAAGHSAADFFALTDLGDPGKYDLSQFEEN